MASTSIVASNPGQSIFTFTKDRSIIDFNGKFSHEYYTLEYVYHPENHKQRIERDQDSGIKLGHDQEEK